MTGTAKNIRGTGNGPITIILVEPDVLARMPLAAYLRECGYRVIEAVSAEDVFLVLAGGEKIEMLLTEIHLPGEIDGFSLAKRVRESYSGIDVVLASSAAAAAAKAGELCDDGPLEKPYHPQEVVRRINRLRERRRASQEPSG